MPSLLMLAGIAVYCGIAARFRWLAPLPLLAVVLFCTGIAFDAFFVTWWPITLSLTSSVRRTIKRGEPEAWAASCATAGGWLAGFAVWVALLTHPCCGGQPHWGLIGAPAAGALVSLALAARRSSPYLDRDRTPRLALDAALGLARLVVPLGLMWLFAWVAVGGEAARYEDRWRNGNAAPP
jgi:hypothetical protein